VCSVSISAVTYNSGMRNSGLKRLLVLALGTAVVTVILWQASATVAQTTGDVDCSWSANSIDAAFVLQFSAGFIDSLPCPVKADPSGDGTTDAVDASLILQFAAGLLDHLGLSPTEPEPTQPGPTPDLRTTYVGTTAAGGEVRFVLSADGSNVLAFIAEWPFLCGGRFVGSLPVRG